MDDKAGGKIVNSDGLVDDEAWGKQAAWVDYSGPVDGQTVGIAILNHPQSLRYPTYWHVRTYGLFAANPFGVHDFLGQPDANGSLTLARRASRSRCITASFCTPAMPPRAASPRPYERYASESVDAP